MRVGGYLPIEDYALIGDGRSCALVGRDGAIDWLCLPNFDSPSLFGAILDASRGGSFTLQPQAPFHSSRRYLPDTNVLETTFETDRGIVRVTDAMTLPNHDLAPLREVARIVEGVAGTVPMTWSVAPRFKSGASAGRAAWRGCVPVATCGGEAAAVASWDAGLPEWRDDTIVSRFDAREGQRATLALTFAFAEPLIVPGRDAVERRLADTIAFWQKWTRERGYEGPWAGAVLRSALVLKALIFAPSGASVAAPTTSLPEEIGGSRNWDYRFCWIRDSNFAIAALLNLGCYDEAQSLFWWFMHATALTEPELHVLYRLDGGIGAAERALSLEGYRRSQPVRVGNGAIEQTQHDVYGCLFETAQLYSDGHRPIDGDIGASLGAIADYVCDIWKRPDSGIWEVRNGPFHFTHSKVMCWVALDRAAKLAERGEVPAHPDRWRREADAIRTYVDANCWSDRLRSYTRVAGSNDVDASLLMLPMVKFTEPTNPRVHGTIDAISSQLRHGDFVYRYRADDGLPGVEGCFLNCSFWLVSALARVGRADEAGVLMERLLAHANDVGLYSEEIDPATGVFLGNFPQALVHLALIDAAMAVREASRS
jgi:GH15 family glucan-1,4-alpha-glucosidase